MEKIRLIGWKDEFRNTESTARGFSYFCGKLKKHALPEIDGKKEDECGKESVLILRILFSSS